MPIGLPGRPSGGAGAIDADAIHSLVAANGGPGRGAYARHKQKTVPAAGVAVAAVYRLTVASGGHVFNRWISARPIRVG